MKALVYLGPNAIELRDVPEPVAEAGEVLVRVEAVGICGSDMHAYHGHDSRRPPPLILGHEAAGHIATGPRKGQRVTINPLVVDPACPYAIEGRWHLSPTRQIISMPPRPGAFAEMVRIPERNLVAIADTMPMAHAALAEPVAVSWHAVRLGMAKLHQPLAACRVVVIGGGAIGLAAALVARHFGAKQIVIGEANPLRRQAIATQEGSRPMRRAMANRSPTASIWSSMRWVPMRRAQPLPPWCGRAASSSMRGSCRDRTGSISARSRCRR